MSSGVTGTGFIDGYQGITPITINSISALTGRTGATGTTGPTGTFLYLSLLTGNTGWMKIIKGQFMTNKHISILTGIWI
jgi:hypothetical protein